MRSFVIVASTTNNPASRERERPEKTKLRSLTLPARRVGCIRNPSPMLRSLLTLLACASLAAAADKPNIVVILADDLGIGDLKSFNPDSKIPTPNLDKLAAAGMKFTDAHSASGVCTPTRYGLLTGRYPW